MQSTRARFLVALLAALCLRAFVAACSKNADDMEDAADSGGDESADVATTPYKPSGQEGSLVGTIKFPGAARPPPSPRPLRPRRSTSTAATTSRTSSAYR